MSQLRKTTVFELESLTLGDTEEWYLRGGRQLLPKLPQAFDGISQIGVIGWSSQGPAQALNLRESLEGTDIKVVVGLRENSQSIPSAEAAGFTRDGGELYAVGRIVIIVPHSSPLKADGKLVIVLTDGQTAGSACWGQAFLPLVEAGGRNTFLMAEPGNAEPRLLIPAQPVSPDRPLVRTPHTHLRRTSNPPARSPAYDAAEADQSWSWCALTAGLRPEPVPTLWPASGRRTSRV
jgi:hypothetical protein